MLVGPCHACGQPMASGGLETIVVARLPWSATVEIALRSGTMSVGRIYVASEYPVWTRAPRVFATDVMSGRRVGLPDAEVRIEVDNLIVLGPVDIRRFARPRRTAMDPHFRLRPSSRITVDLNGSHWFPAASRDQVVVQFAFEGHMERPPYVAAMNFAGMNP